MKQRFDDRISGVRLPSVAGEAPGVASIASSREGWKLTRRTVIGLLGAGILARLPRAASAGTCGPGAFAHEILLDSLSFLGDGSTLVSAGRDSLVKFWTVPGAALFRSLSTVAVPFQVAVSPDSSQIAVAMDDGQLQLWSADGGTKRTLAGHTGAVTGVAFTPDSRQLVSVSADRSTRVWTVADASLLRSFSDSDTMTQVAIPGPARRIAAVVQGSVTLRPPVRIGGADLEPRYVVTAGVHVYLRQLSTGAVLKTVGGKVCAISRDGAFLATHDGTALYMYTFPSLTLLVSVAENRTPVSLAFSADGKRLAIAYLDAPVRLYSSPDLTLQREMEANEGPCQSAAMDPQNAYLAISSGKSIRLYNLPGGDRVQVCFMDIAASAPTCRGTQYLWGGVPFTVGCGAGYPGDGVCTCDCVPGNCPCVYVTGCGCDGDVGCGCDSDVGCSCNAEGCGCVGDAGCSCNSDYGCGCVDDYGCGCEGDSGGWGCGCDGDSGGGWGCDGDFPR